MCFLLVLHVLTFLFFEFANCAETTCADSQQHFANLCFTPKPIEGFEFHENVKSQPTDGWYALLGNDIARLHLAEALKGGLLSPTDNFDDICVRTKGVQANNPNDAPGGKDFGFGNLTSDWNCKYSQDFQGILLCDNINSDLGVTKYHENYNVYSTYTDKKNLTILLFCFPNGQVGWVAYSTFSKTFSDTEKKIITDIITSLGFSENNTVPMYDEKNCS